MKDEIKQIKEWLHKHLSENEIDCVDRGIGLNRTVDLISDCLNDLGLSNEWVSVETDQPKDDDGPYWVLFPCGSVELMRLNPYTLYGGARDFWQDYLGNDRFMNHTYYIKIDKPLPPKESGE